MIHLAIKVSQNKGAAPTLDALFPCQVGKGGLGWWVPLFWGFFFLSRGGVAKKRRKSAPPSTGERSERITGAVSHPLPPNLKSKKRSTALFFQLLD